MRKKVDSRQTKIIELVNTYNIETQEELCIRLNEEGFNSTQATISRDIKELNLTKVSIGNGKKVYRVLPAGENITKKLINVFKSGVLSMTVAQNMLVIKTLSGMAMAVAFSVDSMKFPEEVGSIAGDDTIMIATKSESDCTAFKQRLLEFMDWKEEEEEEV